MHAKPGLYESFNSGENILIRKRLFILKQKPKLHILLTPPSVGLPSRCKLYAVSINTTKIFNNVRGLKAS